MIRLKFILINFICISFLFFEILGNAKTGGLLFKIGMWACLIVRVGFDRNLKKISSNCRPYIVIFVINRFSTNNSNCSSKMSFYK